MSLTAKLPAQPITPIGITAIWLFHLTALLGFYLGYQDWFLSKTPINMGVYTLLLFVIFPISSTTNYRFFIISFLIGMASEWVGVHTTWLFGSYTYGSNLGPKIFEVPLLIGVNWAVLSIITANIVRVKVKNNYSASFLAAGLMVLLDIVMEKAAPELGFWSFTAGVVPLKNYISWFGIALLIQLIIGPQFKKGNSLFSLNLLLSQFVFFIGYLLL